MFGISQEQVLHCIPEGRPLTVALTPTPKKREGPGGDSLGCCSESGVSDLLFV
jgi:hypothetical protein